MRAALIRAFGEPTEVLDLADVSEPSGPAAGEVWVGVEYAPDQSARRDEPCPAGTRSGTLWAKRHEFSSAS
jgi:hypothetical protein